MHSFLGIEVELGPAVDAAVAARVGISGSAASGPEPLWASAAVSPSAVSPGVDFFSSSLRTRS